MTAMNDQYGDGSDHKVCDKCGFCIDCGDCKKFGCGSKFSNPCCLECEKDCEVAYDKIINKFVSVCCGAGFNYEYKNNIYMESEDVCYVPEWRK